MKRWAFRAIAAAIGVLLAMAVLGAADLYLHRKHAATYGVNIWGYRGPALGRKAAGETRIAVLGGSTAFGYGVRPGDDFPAKLQRVLDGRDGTHVSVANLGFNSQGVYSFIATLEDYAFLGPDLVILYEGYNDLTPGALNRASTRRDSFVFRWTGYFPILPDIVRERLMMMTSRGATLDDVYRDRARQAQGNPPKTVFHVPDASGRATDAAVAEASHVIESLRRQVGALSQPNPAAVTSAECNQAVERRWYCELMSKAIEYARAKGERVLVIGQPTISDLHVQQQSALRQMIAATFGRDDRVSYFDVGRALNLTDRALAYDGMHLTAAGTDRLVQIVTTPVLRALGR